TLRYSPSRAFATQASMALIAFGLFSFTYLSGSTSMVLLYLAAVSTPFHGITTPSWRMWMKFSPVTAVKGSLLAL
ncbi:hypothetical protein, partial [Pseudocitrobacter faecalis]|uniref:hypothetical protein n=1 Tax=Pseudocitrobacter faecalis TaxID=1398493 RepID=UPI003D9CACD8